jgi:hypothetical protein
VGEATSDWKPNQTVIVSIAALNNRADGAARAAEKEKRWYRGKEMQGRQAERRQS